MISGTERIFKVFGDRNRLRILCLLSQRKMCVCELAFVLDVSQPSISRHLRKMKECGLVIDEQDGLWTNYFIAGGRDGKGQMLGLIRESLKDDPIIKADLERMKKADRTRLCCK